MIYIELPEFNKDYNFGSMVAQIKPSLKKLKLPKHGRKIRIIEWSIIKVVWLCPFKYLASVNSNTMG